MKPNEARRLSPHELRDLDKLMRARVRAAISDTMQVVDHPEDMIALADCATLTALAASSAFRNGYGEMQGKPWVGPMEALSLIVDQLKSQVAGAQAAGVTDAAFSKMRQPR